MLSGNSIRKNQQQKPDGEVFLAARGAPSVFNGGPCTSPIHSNSTVYPPVVFHYRPDAPGIQLYFAMCI